MKNEWISIYKEWVNITDYQFKILVLASCLENSNLAYYGNYTDMCEWLGISASSVNREKLKEELNKMEANGLIEIDRKSKNKFIVVITNKAKKDKRIVEIKKCWIEVLKNYTKGKKGKINKNWETMLKALVVICYNVEEAQKGNWLYKDGILITMSELAEEIERCPATAGKIVSQLQECDFLDGFTVTKKAIYKKKQNNQVRGLGTYITSNYDWQKQKQ